MAFIFTNPNPKNNLTGDCVIRAISLTMEKDWDDTYLELLVQGFMMKDMPSSNHVWGTYLFEHGFERRIIPDTCPDCYTAEDFCRDHPRGTYVLGFGGHVATVHDGDLFDSWDSSALVPQFYWHEKGEE